MGRKRKGRHVSGWVILDKPAGPTSTAIVNKVKWAFDAQKAGHAGTLDPAATGILAVALGEATKTIPYITDAMKSYRFEVRFGEATNTDDAEGEVIKVSENRPSDEQIKETLQHFIGNIEQVPPQFSAVKIDGQRAYKLARNGEDVQIAARPLFVKSLILHDRLSDDLAILEMECGKGGYVRSIARDLGNLLGCLGHVTWLRRTGSGSFDLSHCVKVEEIERLSKTKEIDDLLNPMEMGLMSLPHGTTTLEGAAKLKNGNPAICFVDAEYGEEIWVSHADQPIAIGQFKSGEIHPSRVFNF